MVKGVYGDHNLNDKFQTLSRFQNLLGISIFLSLLIRKFKLIMIDCKLKYSA